VLHIRFNLITAEPLHLGDAIKFIEAEVRTGVESQPGNLGLALYANLELGVAVLESFWVSGDAMRVSEHAASPSRREAVRRASGTVSVERYQLPIFEREASLADGAWLRLTRMDVEPSGVDDAEQVYADTAVPWLADTEGFCGALLLVDRTRGHLISETIWRSHEALAASRSVAAAVRVDAVGSTGCVIRAVEEYGLIFSSAWKPRS
jgi:heme-degrading monooxygenase HmoA